jgi:hypothetical protein
MPELKDLLEVLNTNLEEGRDILSKASKRVFDTIQSDIDRVSSAILEILKEELREIKEKFPSYHIMLMPTTNVWGNDIGPRYGTSIYTFWHVFGINRDKTLNSAERVATLEEMFSEVDAEEEFYVWENKIWDKLRPYDIEIKTNNYPSSDYLKIMLNHDRYK